MNPPNKHTPSNILRRMQSIGDRQPTREEWAALLDSVHVSMARTICKYAKQGKRPPELDFFDSETEDTKQPGGVTFASLTQEQMKRWDSENKATLLN